MFSILSIWAYTRAQALNRKREWILWIAGGGRRCYYPPFSLWDPITFVVDVFRYPVGLTEHGYPIRSLGFGGLALALGWIPSNVSPFPFEWLQVLFGLPALLLLLCFQWTRNTLGRMWLGYRLFMLVIGVFSHVFNDNHLGFVLNLIAIGLLSDK